MARANPLKAVTQARESCAGHPGNRRIAEQGISQISQVAMLDVGQAARLSPLFD